VLLAMQNADALSASALMAATQSQSISGKRLSMSPCEIDSVSIVINASLSHKCLSSSIARYLSGTVSRFFCIVSLVCLLQWGDCFQVGDHKRSD
jgi:hypothetical protein